MAECSGVARRVGNGRVGSTTQRPIGQVGGGAHLATAVYHPRRCDDQRPGGRTDLELVGNDATVIIEAKKGWLVPGESQLAAYAPRLDGLPHRLLVLLSHSSEMWAGLQLPATVMGVAVTHLSWGSVITDLRIARSSTRSTTERVWLDELDTYLKGATAVRDPSDQWVYCVVVTTDKPGGGASTFREFVERERVYFHPYGGKGGWPKRPPTFMAFRWEGSVRQINRITHHEVVPDLHSWRADIPLSEPDNNVPHIIYRLGPDIPAPRISTKGTWPNARVWAFLDQLLTSATLKEAAQASKVIAPD